MNEYDYLSILTPKEALKEISSSNLSVAQKLVASSLVTQARSFIHHYPDANEEILILDTGHFLGHKVNTKLIEAVGQEMADSISIFSPNIILTAPSLGNISAYATATHLPDKPDVIFAPKGLPLYMDSAYVATSISPIHGSVVDFSVSKSCLSSSSRVVICDDFLDTARTVLELVNITKQAGAQIAAAFFVIEKPFGGRDKLLSAGVPNEQIISLVKIDALKPGLIKLADFEFWFEMVRK